MVYFVVVCAGIRFVLKKPKSIPDHMFGDQFKKISYITTAWYHLLQRWYQLFHIVQGSRIDEKGDEESSNKMYNPGFQKRLMPSSSKYAVYLSLQTRAEEDKVIFS